MCLRSVSWSSLLSLQTHLPLEFAGRDCVDRELQLTLNVIRPDCKVAGLLLKIRFKDSLALLIEHIEQPERPRARVFLRDAIGLIDV